jgi:hypothetical protein
MTVMKPEDLNQAIAAFLICFGQSMPKEMALHIHGLVADLSNQIERGGEATVAKLTRGFGWRWLKRTGSKIHFRLPFVLVQRIHLGAAGAGTSGAPSGFRLCAIQIPPAA